MQSPSEAKSFQEYKELRERLVREYDEQVYTSAADDEAGDTLP